MYSCMQLRCVLRCVCVAAHGRTRADQQGKRPVAGLQSQRVAGPGDRRDDRQLLVDLLSQARRASPYTRLTPALLYSKSLTV